MTRSVLVPAARARNAAFSLLELLLTVVIILILTTLYWGPNNQSRQRALQVSCQKNLQKLSIALELYANDSRGRFPVVPQARTSAEALDPLVPRYTSDPTVFICAASKDSSPPSGASISKSRISYAYYMGRSPTNQLVVVTDGQINTQAKPAGAAVFSLDGKPPGNNHRNRGGNLLFCDGHAEWSPAKTATALPLNPGESLLNPAP